MPDPVDECRDSAAPCKWNHHRSEKWICAVNEAAWEKLTDHEWLKTVGCPRCGHDMFVPYEDSVVIARTVEALERLYGDAPDFADRIADIAEGRHMLAPSAFLRSPPVSAGALRPWQVTPRFPGTTPKEAALSGRG
jgi:hypothetical protein